MDSYTVDKIKHVTNTEVVRRALIQYFTSKGFSESFDRPMYPALMQDLHAAMPMLQGKVEVIPHAAEIDPTTNRIVLGWNLFVLGNHRMYLGETYHNDIQELLRQVQGGLVMIPEAGNAVARRQTTPLRIVAFIARVLGGSRAGYVDLRPAATPNNFYHARHSSSVAPQQFFQRVGG